MAQRMAAAVKGQANPEKTQGGADRPRRRRSDCSRRSYRQSQPAENLWIFCVEIRGAACHANGYIQSFILCDNPSLPRHIAG